MNVQKAPFLFLCAAIALFAQGERGTFNGTVTDPSGAAVAGASVRVVNPETGVEFTSVTTDAGVFRMPSLPPGTYRITVTAPGFKSAVRDNVALQVAQTLTLDFALEVGSNTEQVTVSAESPLLETGTAEIGSYVSKKEFDTLADHGRRRPAADPAVHLYGAAGHGGQHVAGLDQWRPAVFARDSHRRHRDWTHGSRGRREQRVQPIGGERQ